MTKEQAYKVFMAGYANGIFSVPNMTPDEHFEKWWAQHKPAELLDCGCMKWCVGGCL